MRNKKSLTIVDMYKQYVKDYEEAVDYKTFKNILETFHNIFVKQMFE
uniref:Uncharacterized protein n=1 Tax=Dulem virus 42 TaxID=3145760 RepID=A0AAU8B7H4_9CAUD